MKKMSVFSMTAVLFALGLVHEVPADVILDEPNLEGSVGLANETFGSGDVRASWSGGYVTNPLTSGDTKYALRADIGKTLSLRAYMSSFSNSGARLYQYINGIPALEDIPQDKPRTLNLARESGRIRGTVSVTNSSGSEGMTRLNMSSSSQVSSTESDSGYAESYSGYVTDTSAPFAALQPMPALPNTSVYGSATVRKARTDGSTCTLTVSLGNKYVDVPVSGTVDAAWTINMNNLSCPANNTGNIEGNITLSGLDGANSDAFYYQRVYAGGKNSNSLSSTSGSYSISDIPVGNKSVYLRSYFKSPYNGYLYLYSGSVSVADGVTTTHDISESVGTLHGAIIPNGIWDMSDVNQLYAYFTGTATVYDYVDLTSGQFDVVVPVGNEYLYYLRPYFYANNGSYTFSQYYYRYYNSVTSPIKETIAVGNRLENRNLEFETSAIDQEIHLADESVGIKRLIIQGRDYDLATGNLIGSKFINLTSNHLTGSSDPTNGVIVPIYGEPGSYKMTAVADGDDGGTYRKEFNLELISSQCTEAGYADQLDFTAGTGDSIGSVQFDNAACATTAGCTAVNVSNIGPRPPADFKVYSNEGNNAGNSAEYYDISSTVEFCGATVCFEIGNQVGNIRLAHYVCDNNDPCEWVELPSTITGNKICGETPSFSIFAILEPLDQDGDGIFDSEDNCPETPNADQADLDNDGYGDACDSDIDGDGIVDDEDRCPWIASQNNDDLDGDGLGDICDDDIDGDEVANDEDNCPFADNANQADFDGDGQGDACDLDDDNDGIEDSDDNCAGTQADVLIDEEGCSSAQRFVLICPPEASYKNHGKYVSCIAKEAERQFAENLITEEQKDAAVSAAAQTDIGSKK